MADSISVEIDDHSGAVLKCVMMGIVILAVYQVIEIVHHIQYDIGVPGNQYDCDFDSTDSHRF